MDYDQYITNSIFRDHDTHPKVKSLFDKIVSVMPKGMRHISSTRRSYKCQYCPFVPKYMKDIPECQRLKMI